MHYILRQMLPADNSEKPIEIHLTEDEVKVGRRSKIILAKFPQISRDHAIFYKSDNGALFVKDLRSLNGVYVNDAKIGSSLKPLCLGDVVGFGVSTDQYNVGFVCAVSSDDLVSRVKHEVIDISDDDDNVPQSGIDSVSNSAVSRVQDFVQQNGKISASNTPFSNDIATETCSIKSLKLPANTKLQDKCAVSPKSNSVTNSVNSQFPSCDREKGKISEFCKSSFSNLAASEIGATNNSKTAFTTKFQSGASHSKSTGNSVNSHVQSSVQECGSTTKSASLSSEIATETYATKGSKKTTISNFKRLSRVPCAKPVNIRRSSVESLPLKICAIPLIKCDSEYFQWPLDVKNPFLVGHRHSSKDNHKYAEQISQSPNKNFSSSTNKNIISSLRNENSNSIEYQVANQTEQTGIQKRKYPFNSTAETLGNQLSASKKLCLANENSRDNFSDSNKKCQFKDSHKLDSDSDNDVSYSQVEDIIYISDDDEYLDFKSSQNYVHIKLEPEDVEDHGDDACLENEESNDELECLTSHNEVDNFVQLNHENEDKETIESILAFVDDTKQKVVKQYDNDLNMGITAEQNNDFFPVLSQDFDSDEENNIDNSTKLKSYSEKFPINEDNQNFSKENNISNIEDRSNKVKCVSVMNKDGKKSTGKIQLIDPQPLQYRPRRMRGRDEEFVERTKSIALSSAKKQKVGSPKKQSSKEVNSYNVNSNLKFKIPHKRTDDSIKHSSGSIDDDQLSKDDVVSRNTSVVMKKAPVKTRPEQFASRMGFLVNEVEFNPRKVNKPITNVETGRKAKSSPIKNNLSSSVKQSKVSGKNGCISNTLVSQNIPVFPVPSNKPVIAPQILNSGATVYNPRDPRQNRAAISSSRLLKEDSSLSRISMPGERHTQLSTVASSSKASEKYLYGRQNNWVSYQLRSRLIKDLLRLNTKWLEEQSKMKYPPEVVSAGAAVLPLKYDSYNSYVSSFYPMIMLEIWEQMYTESKEVYSSNKQYKKFYFSILSYISKDDYIELKCESVVNEKVSFGPREGSITILELKENSKKCNPLFGYISKHKIGSLNLNSLKLPHWRNLPEEWLKNAKHWTFYAHIKKKEMPFALEHLMKGNCLCYIRNKLRLADALSYVQHSPLLTDILQPKWQTFLVKYSATSGTHEYNSCQMELINGVTTEINKSVKEPKIILLQGPPGTGKTHTIIGLIQKLLSIKKYNPNFKILVAAPSNAVVDEVGCRLIELNERIKSKGSVKFVRVGLEDQIHAKMKPYFIDRKAKELYHRNQSSQSVSKQKDRELQHIQAEINRLEKDNYFKGKHEKLKYLQEKCKLLTDNDYVEEMDYHTEMTHKTSILKDSHIILSTLSGCGISLLLRTFKPPSLVEFSCCIVDESTQCTELEILQPLMLGVRKLILVGDHKQLPATVVSKTACRYGFERSAFERFHTYFDLYCKKTPMFTLTEQFRMHSAICEFPSKFIYDNKVITNPKIDLKYKDFPLLPYMMLDIHVSQETDDSSSYSNCTEAQVIVNICTMLLDGVVESVSSIGIITPYQAQRSLYLNAFGVNPRYKDIEVNTVDGFQGREKDIIILSSVRANSHSGSIGFLACKQRLNVSITRAKKCLIVCGHANSLISNANWRELIIDAKERNVCISVTDPNDMPLIFSCYMKKSK